MKSSRISNPHLFSSASNHQQASVRNLWLTSYISVCEMFFESCRWITPEDMQNRLLGEENNAYDLDIYDKVMLQKWETASKTRAILESSEKYHNLFITCHLEVLKSILSPLRRSSSCSNCVFTSIIVFLNSQSSAALKKQWRFLASDTNASHTELLLFKVPSLPNIHRQWLEENDN